VTLLTYTIHKYSYAANCCTGPIQAYTFSYHSTFPKTAKISETRVGEVRGAEVLTGPLG